MESFEIYKEVMEKRKKEKRSLSEVIFGPSLCILILLYFAVIEYLLPERIGKAIDNFVNRLVNGKPWTRYEYDEAIAIWDSGKLVGRNEKKRTVTIEFPTSKVLTPHYDPFFLVVDIGDPGRTIGPVKPSVIKWSPRKRQTILHVPGKIPLHHLAYVFGTSELRAKMFDDGLWVESNVSDKNLTAIN